jgi:hypothetical protein
MNITNSSRLALTAGVRLGYIVLVAFLALPLTVALGLASYFWLSSDADALRDSFVASVNGNCQRKIVLNVGRFTTGLARLGLGCINNIPP